MKISCIPSTTLSIRIPTELRESAEETAEASDETLTEFVRKAIKMLIEKRTRDRERAR